MVFEICHDIQFVVVMKPIKHRKPASARQLDPDAVPVRQGVTWWHRKRHGHNGGEAKWLDSIQSSTHGRWSIRSNKVPVKRSNYCTLIVAGTSSGLMLSGGYNAPADQAAQSGQQIRSSRGPRDLSGKRLHESPFIGLAWRIFDARRAQGTRPTHGET